MRPVVAVDLAAKFSAGVCLDRDGTMVREWDSYDWSHSKVAQQIMSNYFYLQALDLLARPIVVIEDLPPHVPSSTITKSVAQLQGRILHEFATGPGQWAKNHLLEDVFWVQPSTWQHDMGVWRASPDVAEAVALSFGYTPPDLVERRGYRRGERGQGTLVKEADKQRTDYVDAFLIATWTRQCMEQNKIWDSATVKQYER